MFDKTDRDFDTNHPKKGMNAGGSSGGKSSHASHEYV
jgi:hypothetical protein